MLVGCAPPRGGGPVSGLLRDWPSAEDTLGWRASFLQSRRVRPFVALWSRLRLDAGEAAVEGVVQSRVRPCLGHLTEHLLIEAAGSLLIDELVESVHLRRSERARSGVQRERAKRKERGGGRERKGSGGRQWMRWTTRW